MGSSSLTTGLLSSSYLYVSLVPKLSLGDSQITATEGPISLPHLRMAVSSSAVSDSIKFLFVVQLLLILSGDVEVNPGPLDQGD